MLLQDLTCVILNPLPQLQTPILHPIIPPHLFLSRPSPSNLEPATYQPETWALKLVPIPYLHES